MNPRTLSVIVIGILLLASWWVFGHQEAPDPTSQPAATERSSAVAGTPAPAASTVPQVTTPAATSTTAAAAPAETASQPATEQATGQVTASASIDLPAAEQQQVADFAVTFMEAFARPPAGASSRSWWDRVAAMLTEDAIEDYVGIDPTLVPYQAVTGPGVLVALEGGEEAYWLQAVDVPTDAGTWRVMVQLVTAGISEELLVSSIEEPES